MILQRGIMIIDVECRVTRMCANGMWRVYLRDISETYFANLFEKRCLEARWWNGKCWIYPIIFWLIKSRCFCWNQTAEKSYGK